MVSLYAIVEAGGKQYRVAPGDVVRLEKVPVPAGNDIRLERVLFVRPDEGPPIEGTPFVDGANVTGKVLAHGRRKKIIVFKYKAKSNYRRKYGHRQQYTMVKIESIELPGIKGESGQPAGEAAPEGSVPIAGSDAGATATAEEAGFDVASGSC